MDNKKPESVFGKVAIFVLLVIIIITFSRMLFFSSGGSSSSTSNPSSSDGFFEKTKNVFQSQEKRFGCENGKIENLTDVDSMGIKTPYKVMNGIRTNTVEYPLNQDEVMIEYCFRVANLISELGGLWLTVRFLDKDKNVLAEEDERVADIPGRRIKTIYGSKIVNVGLANEMTNILVSSK